MDSAIVAWISTGFTILTGIVLAGVFLVRYNLREAIYMCDQVTKDFEKTKIEDTKKILNIQMEMAGNYYKSVLRQANISFISALIFAGIGVLIFFSTIVFMEFGKPGSITTAGISVIGGVLVQVLSGINFYMCGRASTQLLTFHKSLDRLQNFVLANSICEGSGEKEKAVTCSQLVLIIASSSTSPSYQAREIGEERSKVAVASSDHAI